MFLSRVEVSPTAVERESFWREVSRPYGAHKTLWALFGRSADQKRDFLFRAEEARGAPSFLVLSAQRPEVAGDSPWRVDSKPFDPVLRAGQRLGFRLRASPVVRRGEAVEGKANRRVHRHDVVMDLAKRLEARGEHVPDAATLTRDAGLDWLTKQAGRAGFRLVRADKETIGDDGLLEEAGEAQAAVRVEGYRQHRISRRGESPIRFSTLDFEGVLEVTEPVAFLTNVAAGFGPQKAFGCGLMLLRRA